MRKVEVRKVWSMKRGFMDRKSIFSESSQNCFSREATCHVHGSPNDFEARHRLREVRVENGINFIGGRDVVQPVGMRSDIDFTRSNKMPPTAMEYK
jgi:hypothetical protein